MNSTSTADFWSRFKDGAVSFNELISQLPAREQAVHWALQESARRAELERVAKVQRAAEDEQIRRGLLDTVRSGKALPPPSPPELLRNWRQILLKLNLKNTDEDKHWTRQMNDRFGGPLPPAKRGCQPLVEASQLLTWYADLERRYTESLNSERDREATVDETHRYGRNGEVVPQLKGYVKQRRTPIQTSE